MKTLLRFLLFLFGASQLHAQATINVPLGTSWFIGSSHGGDNDGSEFWNAVYLRSPSGQLYFDDTFFGINLPGGSTDRGVTLNEVGLWQEWESGGFVATQGADSWSFITRYLNVQGVANRAPSIAWQSAPSNVETGQSYTVSVQGSDPDGNLTQVNVWKNGQPFAFAGGGDGSNGNSGNQTSDNSPQTVTFTAQAVDGSGAVSELISFTVTVQGPPNRAPFITWQSAPSNVETGQTYSVSAQGSDADGNLTQVNVWKNGQPFAFAGGGDGNTGGSGNQTADNSSQEVTFTAQAVDGAGAVSELISFTVTVTAPPPPLQFALNASAGGGGHVSGGGIFVAGTPVAVTASPDAAHDFWGWGGDAGGTGNPLGLTMDRDWSVQALFALKSFNLDTSASAGGSVTPGGTYPYGTTVTLSASPAPNFRFTGWFGDAGGNAGAIAVTMNQPKSVYAQFTAKSDQSIKFAAPGNQAIGSVALDATATSGLPVSFLVLSGPAILSGNHLQITGPGSVMVEARQPGDDTYLPAPSVAQSFNVVVASSTKYRPSARTILSSGTAVGIAPLVLERL